MQPTITAKRNASYSLEDVSKCVYDVLMDNESIPTAQLLDIVRGRLDASEADAKFVNRRTYDVLNVLKGCGIVRLVDGRLSILDVVAVDILRKKVYRLLLAFLLKAGILARPAGRSYTVAAAPGFVLAVCGNRLEIRGSYVKVLRTADILSMARLDFSRLFALAAADAALAEVFSFLLKAKVLIFEGQNTLKINKKFILYS